MIKIERLVKYYGSFLALDGLSLRIDKGELFGFVDPNGAGKTTTMKIIAGLLPYAVGFLPVPFRCSFGNLPGRFANFRIVPIIRSYV